jgi:hypothetical protein
MGVLLKNMYIIRYCYILIHTRIYHATITYVPVHIPCYHYLHEVLSVFPHSTISRTLCVPSQNSIWPFASLQAVSCQAGFAIGGRGAQPHSDAGRDLLTLKYWTGKKRYSIPVHAPNAYFHQLVTEVRNILQAAQMRAGLGVVDIAV